MRSSFSNNLEVLIDAQEKSLYKNLLQQLKKDFGLANTPLAFSQEIKPSELAQLVHEKIYFLILEKHHEYMNLLYVVDIPENEIRKLNVLDAVDASAEVCFLILKREWQKVWFKHKFNS